MHVRAVVLSRSLSLVVAAIALTAMAAPVGAQVYGPAFAKPLPQPLEQYFVKRVAEIASVDWQKDVTPQNWPAKQSEMRKQLRSMLGLDPLPERTPLKPAVTGTVEGKEYVVEKLHFQSLPGVYVTGNLYRPTEVKEPLPAILYVCGHAQMFEGGVRFGNKTGYQHHGVWFARHGYVCLMIDTIQLGEIPGSHHGTHNLDRWWWASRGYTPAGVEAWNSMRAIDYLETRPEVDAKRIGMTGRSGGGSYTWWTAAIDERIKVAVPVAGITNMHNHVSNGVIEGHCDCMYHVNTERWDFDRVAALIAPRALLISNTDKDGIFPLDGVVDVYHRARKLYYKIGKLDRLGLHIAEGPHKDPQQLNIGAFEWMNRFLKGGDRMDLIDEPARKAHEPRELKVLDRIPADERVTTVDEFFVPQFTPPPEMPTAAEWPKLRDGWIKALRQDSFRAWPLNGAAGEDSKDAFEKLATQKSSRTAQGLQLTTSEVATEEPFRLPLWVLHREGLKPSEIKRVRLHVLGDAKWTTFRDAAAAGFADDFVSDKPSAEAFAEIKNRLQGSDEAEAYFCPRATGPQGMQELTKQRQNHLRRRFLLLGESLESGQVWDIRQAVTALENLPGGKKTPLTIVAEKNMAANVVYASIFLPDAARPRAEIRLELIELPSSHRTGPTYLNVLRHLDIPQALALAAEHATITVSTSDAKPWQYAQRVATTLGRGEDRVRVLAPGEADSR